MSARRPAGKHRKPGKHRRANTSPSPQLLLGTAVMATAAATLLPSGASQALGDVKRGAEAPREPALGLAAAPTMQKAASSATMSAPRSTPSPTPSLLALARTKASAPVVATGKPLAKIKAPQLEAVMRIKRASRSAARRPVAPPPPPQWVTPTQAYSLTAHFGAGGGLWSRDHTGQDFAAPHGTPVVAVGAGIVKSADYAGAYGNRIIIEHADGTETWYCHLSSYDVSVGEEVEVSETIGRVGSTGNSTGPHLHFEVRPDGGDAIDPMSWLREHGVKI